MTNDFKAVIFDLDDTLYDTSNRLPGKNSPNYAEMRIYEGAKEILENLKARKILLTHGVKEIQERKIETLGIRDLFDQIIIVEESEDKLAEITKIKNSFTDPKDVAVVGDRRDREIRYGNVCGCVTILIEGFKYKSLAPTDNLEIPTFEIKEFTELSSHL